MTCIQQKYPLQSDLCPQQTRRGEEILHFHYIAMPQHKNPCPGGHEIYNFGRIFLGHHYYTLSLSDLCHGVEEKIFKETKPFHYMTFMAITQIKRAPTPGVMKITILVDSSLVIITIHLVCLICAWEQRRFLKKQCIFTIKLIPPHLSTRAPSLGVIKFTILVDPSLVIVTIHLVRLNHASEQKKRF